MMQDLIGIGDVRFFSGVIGKKVLSVEPAGGGRFIRFRFEGGIVHDWHICMIPDETAETIRTEMAAHSKTIPDVNS